MLLTVDPDVKKSGWAVSDGDDKLISCGLCNTENILFITRVPPCDKAVIELPQVYGKKSNKDPNDLIMLAVVVGEWRALARRMGAECRLVTAKEWKGSRKKWHMHRQAMTKLSPHERDAVAAQCEKGWGGMLDYIERACVDHALKRRVAYGWQMGEVLDAVTMNLVMTGRMR